MNEPSSGSADSAGPVLAQLDKPRSVNKFHIAVISDVHLTEEENGSWKVLHKTLDNLEMTMRDVAKRDVSYVQFLGDLTHHGGAETFQRFVAATGRLSVPTGAVPGNHDVSKADDDDQAKPFDRFKAEYAPTGYPTTTEIEDVALVGLNSASMPDGSLRETWAGKISADQLSKLDSILTRQEMPLIFLHHNLGSLSDHPPAPPWSWFQAKNATTIVNILEQHDAPLAISGHHHLPALVTRGDMVEIISPATCSFPQGYLLLTIGPDGTTVTLVPIADRAATKEAFWSARSDSPLGSGVLSMAEKRLGQMPFIRQ